jgi:hypothetical protein
LGCLEEIFFTVILISHLLKIIKQLICRNGVAKPMTPISLLLEQALGAGEASAALLVITPQCQFSLADSLH